MLMRWIIVFSISLPSWSYNLTQDFINGFYWASLPVKFVVVDTDPARKQLLSQLANAAVSEWENDTGYSLWDITTNSETNIIRWSTNFADETKMDPTSVLAVAIRYTNGPYFAKSEIIINGSHAAFNSPYPSINNINLGTTLVHELGHTMGLDHSDNLLAVMAPTLQYPFNGLHPDDLDGMKEAFLQTEDRQVSRYVSPLAYSKVNQSGQPLSCGTTGPLHVSGNGLFSLGLGMLIPFIRKLSQWFKSLF
jgi:Matrixin